MELSRCQKKPNENIFLFIMASVAALGGFLFGYDTGIISGALIFIRQTYPVSLFMQEIIVSSVVLGALLGALSSGKLADLFGSHRMLIYMAVTFIIGTLLSTFAPSIPILIIGRFIIGIAIGITSYLSPLFISEMAPAKKRGSLVLLNGIMITGGEMIAFLIDYALVPTASWRLMFLTGILPAILLFIGMLMLPASPRWMALKGNKEKARTILQKIRDPKVVEAELNEILNTLLPEKNSWSILFSKWIRPVLIIGIGLGVLQQFIGINTVMYYGPTIFHAAGFTSSGSQILATFGMGLMNTLMTIVAVCIVDKVGRRALLLGGIIIATISLSLVGVIFHYHMQTPFFIWAAFALMLVYIIGYCLSLGSLFWLIISEIYPLTVRSLAMSIATAAQWGASLVVTLSFLSVIDWIGIANTFWIYAGMCFVSFIFCYYLVPETTGISLEQIEQNLREGKRSRDLGRIFTEPALEQYH